MATGASVTATTPPGTQGPVTVTVTNPLTGTFSGASTSFQFTYVSAVPAAPFIVKASAATSTITATQTTIAAGGIATSAITVQLKEAYGYNLPSSGDIVVLATTLGTLSNVTDNGNGTYTATLTSAMTEGTATISGTLAGTAMVNTATVRMTDQTPAVITGPSGAAGAAASAIAVNENQSAVARMTASESVTWSISGGSDAAKFAIADDGTITFVTVPDFEVPTDADANNTYVVIAQAADAAGNVSAQALTVTVLDIDDTAPLITGPSGGAGAAMSALMINEGLPVETRFTANEGVSWSLDGGSDAPSFRINPATGSLSVAAVPDFENPADSDRNNTYVVRVKAVDAAGNVSHQTLTVTIANVDEIGRKLAQIGDKLRTDLRSHAAHSLSDMLSFNESLMRSANDDACSDPKVAGAANASQAGGLVKLDYSRPLSECGRRHQVIADFGLNYSRQGDNWTARMFAALRFETRLNRDLTVGAALMASQASDTLTSFTHSAISDKSLQLNVYGRYQISDRLRTGAFAGYGRGWYAFDLADSDGFVLDGTMTGKRQVYGWMMSGAFSLGETVITTDAIVSHARETLGSAILAARYLGESRSGIAFAVGSVETTRISVPLTAPIQLTGNDELGKSARLLLSPGLLCEDNDVQLSALRCGYQLGARLVANDGGRNRFYADYRWERVAGLRRSLISMGYALRFGEQHGLELALEANRSLTGISGQDHRAMLSLRVVP